MIRKKITSQSLCDDNDEEETQEEIEIRLEDWADIEIEMRFKPLQDGLFSCPYLVIEDCMN